MSQSNEPTGLEIAVVGMAGRFPGAPDVDTLCANLRAGVESIRHLNDEELIAAGVPESLRTNPAYVPARSALAEVDRFDDAAAGGGHLLYTSSAYLLGNLGPAPVDEEVDTALAPAASQWRFQVERAVLAAGGAVVRPGLVYGGRGATMPKLFGGGKGLVAYHGEGTNRWTMVYLGDLAALYLRIARERARGVFHGVDGTPPHRARGGAGRQPRRRWEGRTPGMPLTGGQDEHVERALVRDVAVVSRRSRELGWTPEFASFTQGADRAFAEWRSA